MATPISKRLFLIGLPLSLLLGPWMVHFGSGVESTAALSPLICPLRWVTGYLCPTCGLGRSLVACWSGNLSQALDFHIGGPVLQLACLLCWMVLAFGWENQVQRSIKNLKVRLAPCFLPAVALYSLWGLWRNL